MVLRRWGVLQDNLVLSTGLIMRIGHCKETGKLTFRVLSEQIGELWVVCGLYTEIWSCAIDLCLVT